MSKFNISKCSYIHGDKFIETPRGKFIITPKSNDKVKIFRYLEQRDFPFFLPMENSISDSYELYPYVEDDILFEDKAIDLVHILSLLHIKTTSYQEVAMDSVKKMYEDISNKIEQLDAYYHKLHDDIEAHIYMAPDEYLLVRNISLLYENLFLSKRYLDDWYDLKKDSTRERVVLLHKQPCLSNFVDRKTPYFIHWDLSEKGYPISDFLYFFKQHYSILEMNSLFQIYQSKFQFTKDEMYLFFSLLLLDCEISFSSDHYKNTILVHESIFYSSKVNSFILKQNQKDQETNESKFD